MVLAGGCGDTNGRPNQLRGISQKLVPLYFCAKKGAWDVIRTNMEIDNK